MQTGSIPTVDESRALRLRPPLSVVVWLALYTAVAVAAALMLERAAAVDAAFHWRALAATLVGAALFAWLAAAYWRAPRFGAANLVTLARAALTMLLIALLGAAPSSRVAWVGVALATLAALLDGVDGRIARLRGEATPFGARFDMETDALLILALALLVWRLDKAGGWIVLAGALRYLFVAAALVLPWLAAPLPPSRRRQALCVVQVVALIVCLAPLVGAPASAAIALLGLLLLGGSFVVDVAWLARRG